MALIASGCADVYYEWGIHCWDMAAGKLIIEEAGGVVLSTSGKTILHLPPYAMFHCIFFFCKIVVRLVTSQS